MMHRWVLLVAGIGLSMSGSAQSDLKVLFSFDGSGIQADRVVTIDGSGEDYPATLAELPGLSTASAVILRWVDTKGELLAVTQVADPRIASSPEHLNPSAVSRVGLLEGAWVDQGPDGTANVIVEFPQNLALGLTAETWSVSLRQDK